MRRLVYLTLLAAALVLSGLGHYYLLFRRAYAWDALVFYAVAAALLAYVWYRSEHVLPGQRALLYAAWRRLVQLLRDLVLGRSERPRIALLLGTNGLAALLTLLVPAPLGLLLALPLWAVGALTLGAMVPWPVLNRADSRLEHVRASSDSPQAEVVLDAPPRRSHPYAVPTTIAGWLALAAGGLILGLEQVPRLLGPFDLWLQPRLAPVHVDLSMPPGIWLTGLLLFLLGMALIGWVGAGVSGPRGVGAPPVDALRQGNKRERADRRASRRWLLLALAGGLVWLGVAGAGAAGSTSPLILPLWMAALGVQAACWWRADREAGVAVFSARGSFGPGGWRWIVPTALAVVVALGIVLYRLADVPNSMWGDEGAFWTLARDLGSGTFRPNVFDLGVYGVFPMLGSVYQGWWVALFGPSLWSWRLGSALAGVLALVPLFLLTRRLLGTRVAWSAAALMVSLPYFLAYSRMGYNNVQSVLTVTLTMWLFVEALQRRSRTWAYLAGVAAGAGFLTYTAGYMGLVLSVLMGGYLFLTQRPLRRTLLGLALCLLLGWSLTAGPVLLAGLLRDRLLSFKLVESFFGNAYYGAAIFSPAEIAQRYPLWQMGQQAVFFEPRLYAQLIGRGIVRTLLALVADVGQQHYLVGPLAGPAVLFCLAGLAWAAAAWRRFSTALWGAWLLSGVTLLSAFNTFPPRPEHMLVIIPALAVLAATGIWLLSDLLARFLRPRWADAFGIALTAVLALAGLHAYFVQMPRVYVPDLQNVMFWRAQEMDRGSNLIFVLDAPYAPDFNVWGVQQFDLGVTYHGVPAGEAANTDFRSLCGEACRVFYLPQNAPTVEPRLREQLGEGAVRLHLNRDGQPIGMEFVPGAVQDAPAPGRLQQGPGGYSGPPLDVVLLLLTLGVVLTGYLRQVSRRVSEPAGERTLGEDAIGRSNSTRHPPSAIRHSPFAIRYSLFAICLLGILAGQFYFAQDWQPSLRDRGPHFWPGLACYGLGVAGLLGLTWVLPTATGAEALPDVVTGRRAWPGRGRGRLVLLAGALALSAFLAWDLPRRPDDASHVLPFVVWVAVLAAYLLAFAGRPRWEGWIEAWRARRVELALLVLIALAAFGLRAYRVGSIPFSLGGDEATQGLGAIQFLQGTRTDMFAISDWFFYPNFGYFSLAFSLALFGRTVVGLRMLAVLAGTLSVLLTYLLARRVLGRSWAWVAALFLAAQHYHLHFSRLGSINIFDTVFVPLLAYLLLRGLQEQRRGWFAAAGVTLGVAQYYYNGAKLLPFLLLAVVAYLALVRRPLLRANVSNLAVLALGAALAFLPLGLHELAHPGSFAGRVNQVGTFQSGWLVHEAQISDRSIAAVLGEMFVRTALAFSYFTDQSYWYHPAIPFLDFGGALLSIVGIGVALRYARRNLGYLLVAAWFWLSVVLGGVLTSAPPASERLVTASAALSILVALGLRQIVEYGRALLSRLAPLWRVLPALLTAALMLANVAYYFRDYTPRHIYGNPTAEVLTQLMRDLSARERAGEDGKVYFFGAPFIFYDSSTARFMAPGVEGVDVAESWDGDLGFVDSGRPAWFVVLPERLADLDVVQAAYPDGVEQPVYSSADGRLLYLLYAVE